MKVVVGFLVSGYLSEYLLPIPFICGVPTMFLLALFRNYVGRKVTLGFITAVFVSTSISTLPAWFTPIFTVLSPFQTTVCALISGSIILTYLLSEFAFFTFLVNHWKLKERIGVICV